MMTEYDFSKSTLIDFDITLRNLFDAVKRSRTDLKESQNSVNLSINQTVYRNSELLTVLKSLHKPPRNCSIDMKMIEFLDCNSFDEDLDPFIQKARNGLAVKNVSLTVLLDNIKRLERLSFLYGIFEKVQFQTREAEYYERSSSRNRSRLPSFN